MKLASLYSSLFLRGLFGVGGGGGVEIGMNYKIAVLLLLKLTNPEVCLLQQLKLCFIVCFLTSLHGLLIPGCFHLRLFPLLAALPAESSLAHLGEICE